MQEKEKNTNQAQNKNTLDGISQDRPTPDNNMFWEDESNPLSSKGN